MPAGYHDLDRLCTGGVCGIACENRSVCVHGESITSRLSETPPIPLSKITGLTVKPILLTSPFFKRAVIFTCLLYKSFENTEEKGEIACNKNVLFPPPPPPPPPPQCSQHFWRTFCHFRQI